MQITISPATERGFATTPRERTRSPRYTLVAVNARGSCDHEFVDLESAMRKMQELLVLGIPYVTISRKPASY